jgi:NAD(P)-dependent dehydrogenase (short-subunit alcohol dehydrogenase family)
MRLDGKVAIVTGGAHGMGEAEARLFAKQRAKVAAELHLPQRHINGSLVRILPEI